MFEKGFKTIRADDRDQSSVAKAYEEFDEAGRMKASPSLVDVMEELVKFTVLTRDSAGYLVDKRKEAGRAVAGAAHLAAALSDASR